MKNKFIKSTFILLIGGLVTKILGMIIKIVMTRILGTEGIGTYMLIMPTFSLLIAFAQLGFPVAISKLVAEETKNNKNLVFSTIPISLVLNLIIIFILILSCNFISNDLLHESNTRYGLMCIGFVLPFISISSILRGYFFGKQKMFPHVISNIVEDVVRLIIIFIGVPIFLLKGLDYAIAFIILSNIASEFTSILVLFFFLPKNFKIEKKDIMPNKNNLIDVFSISIPTTISRLIGNIGYFFEPIILTNILLYLNYNSSFVTREYGIINGYVLPMLLLPSFFTMAISQALIPVISKSYVLKDMSNVKRKIKQAIYFSLIVGIPVTVVLFIYPDVFLKLIYNTDEGINYVKVLAPIFILQYIQSPLSASLQAMGKAKISMYGTLIGIIIKTSTLALFTSFRIGMWGLIISTIFGIIFVTCYDLWNVKKLS
jgi:stage V sporulation protein B